MAIFNIKDFHFYTLYKLKNMSFVKFQFPKSDNFEFKKGSLLSFVCFKIVHFQNRKSSFFTFFKFELLSFGTKLEGVWGAAPTRGMERFNFATAKVDIHSPYLRLKKYQKTHQIYTQYLQIKNQQKENK